jgi:hypothetical protein
MQYSPRLTEIRLSEEPFRINQSDGSGPARALAFLATTISQTTSRTTHPGEFGVDEDDAPGASASKIVPNEQNVMARKQIQSNGTSEQIHFPPERIVRLLVGIKSIISMAEARTVSIEDLEELTGRPAGTIGSWLEGGRMHQLEFLFALLERLPLGLRHELVDAACRAHPTLHNPKLAHDPVAVSRLEALLKQRTGFTAVHGGPEHARAYLLSALGNSTRWANFGQQAVVGLDFQTLAPWAPVPGVTHLSPHADNRQQFQHAWSKIKQAEDGSLILLGGVWSRFPSVHSEVGALAARCHIIVADEMLKPEDLARRVPGPVHILAVAPAREQPEWIRITVQGS